MTEEDHGAGARFRSEELREHYELIGQLTVMWNMAQHMVFEIFETVSDLAPETAQAVFFSVKQDSAQRDMTLALCEQELVPEDADLLAALRNAIGRLNRLAGSRNAAIHTMWDTLELINKNSLIPSRRIKYHHRSLTADTKRQFEEAVNEVTEVAGGLSTVLAEYVRRFASRRTETLRSLGLKASGRGEGRSGTSEQTSAPPPPSPE